MNHFVGFSKGMTKNFACDADFLVKVLQKLDDSLNRTKWIVPVTPRGDLEVLLLAAIRLCKRG